MYPIIQIKHQYLLPLHSFTYVLNLSVLSSISQLHIKYHVDFSSAIISRNSKSSSAPAHSYSSYVRQEGASQFHRSEFFKSWSALALSVPYQGSSYPVIRSLRSCQATSKRPPLVLEVSQSDMVGSQWRFQDEGENFKHIEHGPGVDTLDFR